jgi:hypothetical protein
MPEPVKAETENLSLQRSIRFSPSQWEKVEQAAAKLSAREHLNIDPVEVARSGAIRRAEEILAEAA